MPVSAAMPSENSNYFHTQSNSQPTELSTRFLQSLASSHSAPRFNSSETLIKLLLMDDIFTDDIETALLNGCSTRAELSRIELDPTEKFNNHQFIRITDSHVLPTYISLPNYTPPSTHTGKPTRIDRFDLRHCLSANVLKQRTVKASCVHQRYAS